VLPSGNYRLVASVAESSALQPEVYLRDRVTSASVDAAGGVYLKLSQIPAVSLTEVLEVS